MEPKPTLTDLAIAFAPQATTRTEGYATSRGRTDLDKVWLAAALTSVQRVGDAFRSGGQSATDVPAVDVGATALGWLDHLDRSAPKPRRRLGGPAPSLRDVAVRMIEDVTNNVARLRPPDMHSIMWWNATLLDVLARSGDAYDNQNHDKYREAVVIYAATALGFVVDRDFATGRASPE